MTLAELERHEPVVAPEADGAFARAASRVMTIWVAGILIRLLLMPFAVHTDAYSIYSRAADAAYDGEWLTWGSQFLIQTVHNVWLLIIRPLLPDSSGIWSETSSVIGVGTQPEDMARFLDYPYLNRALFLMKIPYLVADLATGWVLMRLVQPLRQPRVLALWLLNPLVIFVSVVFARHDSMSIFLVVLSIYVAMQGRRYLGLGLLAAGGAARLFPIFLAPFYVLAFRTSRQQFLALAGGLVGIWFTAEALLWGLTGESPTLTLLTRYPHIEYLIDLSLGDLDGGTIFIFPVAYVLLLLWFADRAPSGVQGFVPVSAAVMLLLFALTFFHPQYTIVMVPFLALTIDRDSRLIAAHIAQLMLLGLLIFWWGTAVTWDLFLPIGADVLNEMPDPLAVVGAAVPADLFLGVVRSLFAGVSLWMAWTILRNRLGMTAGSRRVGVLDATP